MRDLLLCPAHTRNQKKGHEFMRILASGACCEKTICDIMECYANSDTFDTAACGAYACVGRLSEP